MTYREKLMRERKHNISPKLVDDRYCRPWHRYCIVCYKYGYIIKDCNYTFERVLEDMLEFEKRNSEKIILSKKGGIKILNREEDTKRYKVTIENKKDFFNKHKGVVYND